MPTDAVAATGQTVTYWTSNHGGVFIVYPERQRGGERHGRANGGVAWWAAQPALNRRRPSWASRLAAVLRLNPGKKPPPGRHRLDPEPASGSTLRLGFA